MKVKDLPETTNLINVKVRLPEDVLAAFKRYIGGEEVMYVAGPTMGEFFMTPDPYGGSRRLYPFPPHISEQEILEWEVVENENQTDTET